jgi:putative methionine-R-sulfoxide reductase with GAF domain
MQANNNKQKLGVVFTFMFFAALLFSAYTLYSLPGQLSQHSLAIDLLVLDQLNPVFFQAYLVFGATALLGMTTVTLLLSKQSDDNRPTRCKVVQEKEKEKQVTQDEEETEEYQVIDQQAVENLIETVEDTESCFTKVLSQICNDLEASQAAAYLARQEEDKRWIELFASYAYHIPEGEKITYRFGEGLAGQVAKEGKPVNIDTVPEGYISILSGLGSASPRNLIIVPLKEADSVVGVVEIASFKAFSKRTEMELQQALDKLALKLEKDHNVSLEKAKS